GASWGKDAEYKHWPAENFASLADRLSEKLGAKIVLVGAGDEIEIAGQVERDVKMPLVNLAGKTSLEELCAVIKNCAVLVTNDGGPLHIAVAQGVKTVSIFGPVDEKVYGPFPASDLYIALKNEIPCRPCYKNFRFSGCDNNRACLTGISVDEVFEAVTKVMSF
ncbi:MAG: glycosyltransferase family 9 protein, partial [Candidatus Omnitrophica bacterium]|nr:glycosyltransferase family 9 protein [Candidatus Omnitrophota bacterium]